MDLDGEMGVNSLDFLTLVGEYGQSAKGTNKHGHPLYCVDGPFSGDGYLNVTDSMGWDWYTSLLGRGLIGDLCNLPFVLGGSKSSSTTALSPIKDSTPSSLDAGPTGFEGELLVAGKIYDPNLYDEYAEDSYGQVFMSDRLYGLDGDYNFVSGPFARLDGRDRSNSRLVMDHAGELYQLNIEEGLIPLFVSDQNSIVPPSSFTGHIEPRYEQSATVHVGLHGQNNNWWGRPILDAVFDSQGYVYVTPVVVVPSVSTPYLASAKLQLKPNETPPYSIVKLYDDPDTFNASDPNNPNMNGLCEVEVDSAGNLYVLNAHIYNYSDILWKYRSNGTIELLDLGSLINDSNFAPIAMHVSDATDMLYLASSLNQPEADSVSLYVLSTDTLNLVKTIQIFGMGHITDITEDPTGNTLWVVGFKMQAIPDYLVQSSSPFYEPYLAKILYGDDGPIIARSLSGSGDLALPVSIVWTGDKYKCAGADLDESGDVSFADVAILVDQWLQPPGSPSADIAPENPDSFVNLLDYAVLAGHWLETGCK
jgi:hypothetical protein